jgi:8-oxo-dGTP pyrophosphatase MutT (NUDIX family)
MADRAPAHISLVYPEEHDNETLLLSRAAIAAEHTAPFRIGLDNVAGENEGLGGVWFLVEDPSKTWETLRDSLLSDPFSQLQVSPHVTITHPRTTNSGPQALSALANSQLSGDVELREIAYTETTSRGMRILERFELTGTPAKRVVGAILRDESKVLLCLSSKTRVSYPGVWDVPGGHLEYLEAPEQALTRELEEELGIKPHLVSEEPWEIHRLDGLELNVFLVDQWAGDIQNLAVDEHEKLYWATSEEIAQLHLAHPKLADLLARALKA